MDEYLPAPASARPLSYACLIGLVSMPDANNQERNRAFLNGLSRHLGRLPTDDASRDLNDETAIQSYLSAAGATSNRRSAIVQLRQMVDHRPPETCSELLGYVLGIWTARGGSRANLAKHVGIPETSLAGYIFKSQIPTEAKRAAFEKLEVIGGLQPGSLTRFLSDWATNNFQFKGPYFDLANPFYFWNHKKQEKMFGPKLIAQVEGFLEYKTYDLGDFEAALPDGSVRILQRRDVWTKSAKAVSSTPTAFSQWNYHPSVFISLSYLGRLAFSANERHGSKGDTLAAVLDSTLVEQCLRADVKLRGVFHGGHEGMVAFFSALLHPKHGYIVQLPEFFMGDAERLDLDVGKEGWVAFVARQHALIAALPSKIVPNRTKKKRKRRSRDKKKKLQAILSHEDAYSTYVFPTLLRMQAERPPDYAPEFVKIEFEVQVLTFVLFAACPLRLLNWSLAQWDKHLRRTGPMEWWVEVPLEEQKNRRVLECDLRIRLPKWAATVVERYYEEVRPRVAAYNPFAASHVMAGPRVTSRTTSKYRTESTPEIASQVVASHVYSAAGHRIAVLTKLLWNVRVSPHDWRDIYATDYLHKNPGDILTVAMVLNDKPETILREYATPDSARLSRIAAENLDREFNVVAAAFNASRIGRGGGKP